MAKRSKLFFILLIILVPLVFSPCLGFKFLHWDDHVHFLSNPCVYSLSWQSICDLFQQTINDTYIPLTTLSFNLEYHLFGPSPLAAHLINVLLHLAVVLVVFGLAQRLKFSPWQSFMASAIFAIHPIHVESVAWVTERKDVLGVLFYVLCLEQYWLYLESNSRKNYGLSVMFGLLGILAKPMAVSLPWVLLLLDWFYQRRYSRSWWLDKLPFAILIFPIALITVFKLSPHPEIAQNSILIGIWGFSWYLEKFLLPFNLLPAYSPPVPVTLSNFIYLQALVVFIVFIGSIFLWRKNRLYVFACLFWIGTIFFLWRVDFADINIVADRFMYLPSLGFCLLLGRYLSKFKAIAILLIIILGALAFNQCHIWRHDLTLWTWTLSHDPKNALAKKNLDAVIFAPRKKAVDYKTLTEAIDKDPSSAANYIARGEALLEEGDYYLAYSDFNKAVKIDPLNDVAYNMRGQMYVLKGENEKARDDFNKAITLKPENVLTSIQMGVIAEGMHDPDQALTCFDRAIKINPLLGGGYYQRGLLSYNLGRYEDAIDDLTRSITLKNDLKNSYYNRGKSYAALGQFDRAEEDFYSSLREDPNDAKTLNELGVTYLTEKDYGKAIGIFNKTIAMHPYDDNAYINRGIVYIQQKQYDLALKDYTKAISLELYPYHALITRGDIYFVMGERQKALRDFNLACSFSQGDPIAQMKRDHLENML